ncbi:tripartite motif-containing protein 16-like [Gambusia affinis]|uniref:tripartite motif-containing protein 16-like n=1 Tax=Gambusia affinis TaxID=33528 RepID=UPI001CDC2229|nr:tripartite motif-containing protein 16-like [Gambusia affinis]
MAQGIELERERFCCCLCTNLLRDPVTIPCGHNFCMICISKRLDNEEGSGIYICPQCSEIFISRPMLIKNSMTALVIDELMKNEVQPEVPDIYRDTESIDVAWDFCSEMKVKAVTHLQPHNEVPPLRKHRLVEPTASLEESICPVHQEVMKVFCQTDQRCICYLCSKDSHKGHNKVSMSAERTERQEELRVVRQKMQLRIVEKKKDVRTIQQEEDAVSHAADSALSTTEVVFTELSEIIEKKLSRMKEKINSQQSIELGLFRKVRHKVEEEILELNRKDIELDKLSRTEDHAHFLLKYPSLSRLSISREQPSIGIHRQRNFDLVPATVLEARTRLHKVLDEECEKILLAITSSTALPDMPEKKPEEKIRKPRVDFYNTVGISKPAQRQTTTQFMQAKLLQNLDSNTPFSYIKPKLPDPSGSLRLPRQKSEDLPSSEYFTDKKAEPTRNVFPDRGHENPDVIPPIDRLDVLPISPIRGNENVLKTRANFLEYACKVTLNPDTAFPKLLLTKENRKVTFVSEEQDYPNHPDRFIYTWQVLSQQSLTGRCYLEVERTGKGVMVAMAYKGISRAGTFSDCMFGQNGTSWGLDCFKNSCEFRHNKNKTPIPGTWSSRVGVYLDYKAGILAFYSVSETMTLLHRVETRFTEPLYVGLWLSDGATAEICKLV